MKKKNCEAAEDTYERELLKSTIVTIYLHTTLSALHIIYYCDCCGSRGRERGLVYSRRAEEDAMLHSYYILHKQMPRITIYMIKNIMINMRNHVFTGEFINSRNKLVQKNQPIEQETGRKSKN